MPELPSKPVSVVSTVSILQEQLVIPKIVQLYEYIFIPNWQLNEINNGLLEITKVYNEFANQVTGVVKEFVEAQKRIVVGLNEICGAVSVIDQVNITIRTPVFEFPTISNILNSNLQLPPSQIFIQPDQPHYPIKTLPSKRRKATFPLTVIHTENNGFTINGEYIAGMTRGSKPGRLLELVISKDLEGVLPDNLIYHILKIDVGDYRTLSFVLRDLKKILAGNKLELNTKRYQAIAKYKVSGITKRIRNPKKVKKLITTRKIN